MKIAKLSKQVGAEVTGVDLARELVNTDVAAILSAFNEHGVLIFAGQRKLSAKEHLHLARSFGETEPDDFQTLKSENPEVMVLDQINPKGQGADRWHADNTYREEPPQAIMIQAHQTAAEGGDTCFASMAAAWDLLSPPLQRMLKGLKAVHSVGPLLERTRDSGLYELPEMVVNSPPMSHHVVAKHPVTGRKYLNVNSQWVTHIEGLEEAESNALLDFLYEHIKSPEVQIRHRWREGDIAFWDNRSLLHYAVADYDTRRVMQRIVLAKVRQSATAGSGIKR
ncbi:MAG: TauD/TfdA family dioxygenase [Novosphingobium sp.]|nr:TauD/TfdA family dioxygenase [Novosphingobium sp.]